MRAGRGEKGLGEWRGAGGGAKRGVGARRGSGTRIMKEGVEEKGL